MSCLMLAATLALGVDPQPAPPARAGVAPGQQGQAMASQLDGSWTVLCVENDGQKLGNGQNETVTIHGNVLTWQKEGKEHRVRLQLGPNNTLTASPEREENNAKTRAKTAEQPANAPASEAQNKIIGSVLLRSGANGQGGQALPMHQGVYIESSDFLCLFLSQGFEGEMHGQQAAGAEKAATPNAPKQQTARPAQNAANTPQQGTEVKGAATTGTTQAKNEPAAKAGETRTANYGAEQHHAGNMQQKGFVLILRREGTQQPQGRGK